MEEMIPVPAVMENELSESKRAVAAAKNSNITISITGVPTIEDEELDVVIDKESNSKVKMTL